MYLDGRGDVLNRVVEDVGARINIEFENAERVVDLV